MHKFLSASHPSGGSSHSGRSCATGRWEMAVDADRYTSADAYGPNGGVQTPSRKRRRCFRGFGTRAAGSPLSDTAWTPSRPKPVGQDDRNLAVQQAAAAPRCDILRSGTGGLTRPSSEKPMRSIRRRDFVTFIGGAAVWPIAARAQQPGRMRRVGVLMAFDENDPEAKTYLLEFTQGLAELGWTDGSNLRMDVRWGAGNVDRIEIGVTNERRTSRKQEL